MSEFEQKKETEKREETSPHTPYKEREEGEKEAAAERGVCSRGGANGNDLLKCFFSESPKEREAFVKTPPDKPTFLAWAAVVGLTDTTWLDGKWSECHNACWCDENGNAILNWTRYFLTAAKGDGKKAKPRKTYKGAYKRLSEDIRAMFDSFWTAYPNRRRTCKDKCADLFRRILTESGDPKAMFGKIMEGLGKWKASSDWQKENGEYVMMPHGWLYNENWETPPEGSASGKKTTFSRKADNWRGTRKEDIGNELG